MEQQDQSRKDSTMISPSSIFGSVQQMSDLPDDRLFEQLRILNEEEVLASLRDADSRKPADTFGPGSDLVDWLIYPFRNVTNLIGFFDRPGPLRSASDAPDPLEPGESVRLLLDRLHVHRYPGLGPHDILFEGTIAWDSLKKEGSKSHFARQLSVRSGAAAIGGWPLFSELIVPERGITLAFQTINLSSRLDKALSDALGSKEFEQGLKLVGGAMPAVAQVSTLVRGLIEWAAAQSGNCAVQQVDIGLDARNPGAPGARLAEGSYVFLQVPQAVADVWHFDQWKWSSETNTIVSYENGQPLVANHFIVSVSRR
ncbi:MAG: hypothetical protein GYB53_19820 [Rhodobacteraceae bacterium]|nr:hypothetical protein [Paracoccaceae bacterium]MBR9823966.1 hypothetical protein [Paracoccaceae bacterium]